MFFTLLKVSKYIIEVWTLDLQTLFLQWGYVKDMLVVLVVGVCAQ